MIFQESFSISTSGRGTTDITSQISERVICSKITTGLCQIFIHHTSASLILCENADPDVRYDLETFMARLAPDGDPMFVHDAEGPDDMPAHVRSILTNSGLSIPVIQGRLGLGTWQGIYLWEHRTSSFRRKVTITVLS